MRESGKSLPPAALAVAMYLAGAALVLSGCAVLTPSTYAEWKAKQEVRAEAAKMQQAAEGVTFKPADTK